METPGSDRKTSPRNDPEHFRHELAFIDGASRLVEALKKGVPPTNLTYHFEIPALSHGEFAYPLSLEKKYGLVDYESVDVTVCVLGVESSTKIELLTSANKRIHISRNSVVSEEPSDQIVDEAAGAANPVVDIPRIPNTEINDFLYSITRRGENPASNRYFGDTEEETVDGQGMCDALSDAALNSHVHFNYELHNNQTVWFTFKGSLADEKLIYFSLTYQDYEGEVYVVEIDTQSKLNISFKHHEADGVSSVVLPTKKDYVVAKRAMDDIMSSFSLPTDTESKMVSRTQIEDLTDTQLAKIQGI